MKIKAAALLLLMAIASTSSAQDRWRYAGSSEEFAIYVDFSTFSKEGDVADAWVEYRYDKPKMFSRVASLFRVNCAKRTRQTLASVSYGPDGAVTRSTSSPEPVQQTVPGTAGELVWGGTCPEAATPLGLDQAGAALTRLRAADPEADRKLRDISPMLDTIQKVLPPTLWAEAIEEEWRKLK